MIWCSLFEDQPYSSNIYDPFWAAAQEFKMPASLHAITGMGMESQYNGRALSARRRAGQCPGATNARAGYQAPAVGGPPASDEQALGQE
jgi:hypothetical protein